MTTAVPLVKHGKRYELPLAGRVISQCLVDFAFSLAIFGDDHDSFLRIEEAFTLDRGESSVRLNPGEPSSLGPALALHNKLVTSAHVSQGGALVVSFSDNTRLKVRPNATYEAWEFNASTGLKVVCMPGGELAIWDDPQPQGGIAPNPDM
jgi:hypothetical protein